MYFLKPNKLITPKKYTLTYHSSYTCIFGSPLPLFEFLSNLPETICHFCEQQKEALKRKKIIPRSSLV